MEHVSAPTPESASSASTLAHAHAHAPTLKSDVSCPFPAAKSASTAKMACSSVSASVPTNSSAHRIKATIALSSACASVSVASSLPVSPRSSSKQQGGVAQMLPKQESQLSLRPPPQCSRQQAETFSDLVAREYGKGISQSIATTPGSGTRCASVALHRAHTQQNENCDPSQHAKLPLHMLYGYPEYNKAMTPISNMRPRCKRSQGTLTRAPSSCALK